MKGKFYFTFLGIIFFSSLLSYNYAKYFQGSSDKSKNKV